MKYQKVHSVYPCITAQFPQYYVLEVLKVLKCIEPPRNPAKLMLIVSPIQHFFFHFGDGALMGIIPKRT